MCLEFQRCFGMDELDFLLLEELQKDAGRTRKQLARKLLVPLTTVHNRIAKLEKNGVVKGYAAAIDYKKAGFGVGALVDVSVKSGRRSAQEEIARRIAAIKGVEEAFIVTGATDIVAKAWVKDTDALNDLLLKEIGKIDGVDKTVTLVILKQVK